MLILSIDTSADDTCAAVLKDNNILTNIQSSQIDFHNEWGGIVPMIARRSHEEKIDIVVNKALKQARLLPTDIDFVAVTYGPGLAIALEVGIKYAKEFSAKYNKRLIAVNHVAGHIYANFAQNSKGKPIVNIKFPLIALVVSGGHTEFVLMKDHLKFEKIGETLDDAAGEAYDKVARMLGFGYPGGPYIEEIAKSGDPKAYKFPRPMEKSGDLNLSFSGLKTAVLYKVQKLETTGDLNKTEIANIAASFQEAVIDILVQKAKKAVEKYQIDQLIVGGGVIANLTLRSRFRKEFKNINFHCPTLPKLYTDNAAMIGIVGYYKALKGDFIEKIENLDRDPVLSL